jgi:hypothetical protein
MRSVRQHNRLCQTASDEGRPRSASALRVCCVRATSGGTRRAPVYPCRTLPHPTAVASPPGKIRTIEEVAAWARRVVSAYEEIEADPDECARSLGQLERMIGDE